MKEDYLEKQAQNLLVPRNDKCSFNKPYGGAREQKHNILMYEGETKLSESFAYGNKRTPIPRIEEDENLNKPSMLEYVLYKNKEEK